MGSNRNIDIVVNDLGYEIVQKINEIKSSADKKKMFNLIDKALGVLVNDGVYAYYVFCKSKSSECFDKNPFIKLVIEKLNEYVGIENKSDEEFFKSLSGNLHKLLFFRELLERALIYARYHADAVGDINE